MGAAGVHRAALMRRALAAFVVTQLLGCALVLDVDQYDVADGSAAVADACAPRGVPATDGGCMPVGVTDCGADFDPDGEGGCVERVAATCTPTELAVPGQPACTRVSILPCPASADPKTFAQVFPHAASFVWSGYAGGDSDGSAERPWTSVAAALVSATAGDEIVVAPGTYEADHSVARPVHLRGVCADAVTLVGATEEGAALTISASASGTSVEGLRISGAGAGIRLNGASDVSLRELIVDGTARTGVELLMADPLALPTAQLERVLVTAAGGTGLAAWGYDVTARAIHVRDTVELPLSLASGVGISVHPGRFCRSRIDPRDVVRSKLTLTRSLVERSRYAGVRIVGSPATLEGVVVRDTRASDAAAALGAGAGGWGIDVEQEVARGLSSKPDHPVTITRAIVARSVGAGIRVFRTATEISATTVRDTAPESLGACAGHGVRLLGDTADGALRLTGSFVADSTQTGVHVLGGVATIDGTIVRRTTAACGRWGDGVAAYAGPAADGDTTPSLVVRASRVDGAARAGVAAFGASVRVDGGVVSSLSASPAPDGPAGAAGAVTVGDGALCGRGGVVAACGPASVTALEPALFARTDDGARAPEVRLGAPVFDNFGNVPIARALVWIEGRDEVPVVVADDAGVARGDHVPADSMVSLVFAAPDRFVSRRTGTTRRLDPLGGVGLARLEVVVGVAADILGSAYDFSLAQATVWTRDVFGGGLAGFVATVPPASGASVFYFDAGGLPIPPGTPQRTTSAGSVSLWRARPGVLDVSLGPPSSPALTCTREPDFHAGLLDGTTPARLIAFPGGGNELVIRCVAVP